MKVILTKDIDNLGLAGDVNTVKPGYGRNYLLPNGLAILASPAALADWEKAKDAREARRAKQIQEAKELAEKVDGTSLSFPRPVGEGGKLFGSVGKADIVESLKATGFDIDKNRIILESPFKEVGEYEVALRVLPGVTAKVKISVVPQS